MKKAQATFIISDHCKLPLGNNTEENWKKMIAGESGIRHFNDSSILPEAFQAARWDNYPEYETRAESTALEKLIIESIEEATASLDIDLSDPSVIFVGATTKGNIDLLEHCPESLKGRERPGKMAEFIAEYFKNPNKPWLISNACISGVLALQTAHQLLQNKQYEHAVVFGGDLVSHFTLSGFYALKAISDEACRPFDKNRKGISLGEGAATIVLSRKIESDILMAASATSNDANHISGPSRTGDGLSIAIKKTLQKTGSEEKVDFISSHGTATLYNDEMEALALQSCQLNEVPMHSIKGYAGHTLGAAGLVESCILLESMRQNKAPGTKGFENSGVSVPLNISSKAFEGKINTALKTASGFGGCNAAALFIKS
ncbi:MAG: beta-ketoacyl synthase N-terminal-like domain-containing protein [Chitinophagales bacterium]